METQIPIRFLITAFALGISVLLFLGFREKLKNPYFSSSSETREQHRASFEQLTIPRPAKSPTMPGLADVGDLPAFTITSDTENELRLDYSFVDSLPPLDAFADVFEADINHEVILPRGVRLKLTGMALTLPEEAPGIEKDRYAEVKTTAQWLNPRTFEPPAKGCGVARV